MEQTRRELSKELQIKQKTYTQKLQVSIWLQVRTSGKN